MKIHWHAENNQLHATQGDHSVSVELQWDHFYTDARLWRKYLEAKMDSCKDKLGRAEACETMK
jgi:hypothetical protein